MNITVYSLSFILLFDNLLDFGTIPFDFYISALSDIIDCVLTILSINSASSSPVTLLLFLDAIVRRNISSSLWSGFLLSGSIIIWLIFFLRLDNWQLGVIEWHSRLIEWVFIIISSFEIADSLYFVGLIVLLEFTHIWY